MDTIRQFAWCVNFGVFAFVAWVLVPPPVGVPLCWFFLSVSSAFWVRGWFIAPIVRAIDALPRTRPVSQGKS